MVCSLFHMCIWPIFDGYHVIENQQYFSDESVIQKMDLALVKTDSDGYPMIPKSNINLPGDWLIIPIGTYWG